MKTVSYTVRELKNLIKESANEFEPKLGPNVMKDNKANNEKSYKDVSKQVKDYDGGISTDRDTKKREDRNRTMMDLNPVVDPGKEYKAKVDAQRKGYSSELEMNNGSEKIGDFEGNKKIAKDMDDNRKYREDLETKFAKSGLQASKLPDEQFKKNHLSENRNPKAKKLTFKKRFINEANMLQRIPDEYKVDGQQIIMEDRFGNKYIVECSKSEKSGIVETNVTYYNNKQKLDEQLDRMYRLFDFEPDNSRSSQTSQQRIEESRSFGELMNLARGK